MSSISFICDVCGREVMGFTFVNGMKFCAKCYQETFGNKNNMTENLNNMYDAYLKILAEKDAKITDLEAKLAEKEYLLNIKDGELNNTHKLWQNKIDEVGELKQQLAEKDHSIGMLNQHLTDKTIEIERLSEELEEINREFAQSTHDWKEIVDEKEKEIEKLKRFKVTIGTMENNQVDISSTIYTDQSKTEFAIQQLQRVKADIVNNVSPVKLSYTDYVQAVFGELDQIIEELEGKDAKE